MGSLLSIDVLRPERRLLLTQQGDMALGAVHLRQSWRPRENVLGD